MRVGTFSPFRVHKVSKYVVCYFTSLYRVVQFLWSYIAETTWREDTTWRLKRRWEDNIRM